MMKADRVFKNAKVYSVALDGTETRAESVAVKDGKFVFIGSNADAENYIDQNTVITDCKGGSILPGFCDSHMHFSISVRRFGVADLYGLFANLKERNVHALVKDLQKTVKEFADSHPNDAVIHGSGWDRAWFLGELGGEVRHLSRHDIDAVVPDRPVVLDSTCGHATLFNTKALEVAGITKDTPDMEGGIIRREADGTPDGYFQEPIVIQWACGRIPDFEYTYEQHRNAILAAQDFFAARGFTYLCDCMAMELPYQAITDLAKEGKLNVRLDGVFNCNDGTREQDYAYAVANKGKTDVGDIWKIDTVKYFMDGEFAMLEPYPDKYCDENGLPRGYGTTEALLWDVEHYRESFAKVQEAGFNIHVHCFGDLATKETVNAMENAQKYDKKGTLRNVIAHDAFVAPEDKKRMAKAGIIAAIQPQWEYTNEVDSAMILDNVGAKRFGGIYPNGSLVREGIVCTSGSDFTVTLPDALEGMATAMLRRAVKSSEYYEAYKDFPAMDTSECITLKDALMSWTINGAYQFHRENVTGSIEVGKSAELVVLDGDIENTPVEDICSLKIMETVFKGKTTFLAK